MKETATTTSLGSIGQITEDHEVVVDLDLAVDADAISGTAVKNESKTAAHNDIDDLDINDADEIVDNYADSWSYEVPRPWLTVDQAASMLGRSARGVERSILGRWGNHLPEGWAARRVRIDGVEEWRIIPPPGFRIKHSRRETNRREGLGENNIEDVEGSPVNTSAVSSSNEASRDKQANKHSGKADTKSQEKTMASTSNVATEPLAAPNEPFSLEKFLHSAGKMAQKELASFGLAVGPVSDQSVQRNRQTRSSRTELAGIVDADIEHATIVIDRSDEVEKLLRELADTQKELSEQRRMHLEDLRLMQEMQRSMLLLEVNAKETGELKQDLTYAQQALKEHRTQYQAFLALPWYKKLFRKTP